MRCSMRDERALLRLLELFSVTSGRKSSTSAKAMEQFKHDLTAVLQALREKIDAERARNLLLDDPLDGGADPRAFREAEVPQGHL